MENESEVPVTHNEPEGETPQVKEPVEVTEDLDELRHRAEVSSQNFERAKKAEQEARELKERLELIESTPTVISDDVDYGTLQREIAEIKGKLAKTEVIEKYPVLKDSWKDLESFRETEENKGMNLNTAAKAFLIEKGLLDQPRKGLEKQTGGDRVPVSSGMSSDDAKKLRETNYKKYVEMIKKGQIKVS